MKIRIPSPAMIVATLALLVALSGTAVASTLITGAQIKNNTVSTLDITNGTVQAVDVKNNALTTDDIKNGTLKPADFAPGVLTSGAPGAPGAPGAQGAPGLANVEVVTAVGVNNSTTDKSLDATCPDGKRLIGGGARNFNAGGDLALDESYPAGTKWHAAAYEVNPTAVNWHLEVFAICATIAA